MVDDCLRPGSTPGVALPIAEDSASCIEMTKLKRRSICAGCHTEIYDQFLLRVHPNLEWHAQCLKCVHCQKPLDEHCTAFLRDGRTYCKLDYLRMFTTKCARCDQPFGRTDMVIRARHLVYHQHCFVCSQCDRVLRTGEEFAMRNDELLCKMDCDIGTHMGPGSLKNDLFSRDDDDCWDTSTLTSLDNHLASTPPLSIQSPKSDEGIVITSSHANVSSSSSSGSAKKHKKDKTKTTRIRTVLNEKQLMTLKTCYGHNSRPDALMKEQLVEMTGLNARVIRVWFQNKRCKDKKRQIAMKQQMQAAEKDRAIAGVRLNGIGPLTAGSPIAHHDPSMAGIGPLDVHQFSQNPALWATGPHGCDGGIEPPPPFHHQMMPPGAFNELGGTCDVGGFLMPGNGHHQFVGAMDGEHMDFSPHVNVSDLSSPSCSE